ALTASSRGLGRRLLPLRLELHRQPQRKGGAAAGLALERDLAAEQPRDRAADGEAEAGAGRLARRREARELLEDPLLLRARDAGSGVRDGDAHGGPGAGRLAPRE